MAPTPPLARVRGFSACCRPRRRRPSPRRMRLPQPNSVPVTTAATATRPPHPRGPWMIQVGAFPKETEAKERLREAQTLAKNLARQGRAVHRTGHQGHAGALPGPLRRASTRTPPAVALTTVGTIAFVVALKQAKSYRPMYGLYTFSLALLPLPRSGRFQESTRLPDPRRRRPPRLRPRHCQDNGDAAVQA